MQATDTEWIERATTKLRESGRRSGGARAEVITRLARVGCAVSAEQIADSLRVEGM